MRRFDHLPITGAGNANYQYDISEDETQIQIKVFAYSGDLIDFSIPLVDLRTRIKNAKLPPHRIWKCLCCGKHTDDRFMATSELWSQIVGDFNAGVIHYECFETRVQKKLGRNLQIEDFIDCPLNSNIFRGFKIAKQMAFGLES